jgi:hypothetical protein
VKAGVLRALSVGFAPIEMEPNGKGGFNFNKWELLEVSVVAVPANPGATVFARDFGKDGRVLSERHALAIEKAHRRRDSAPAGESRQAESRRPPQRQAAVRPAELSRQVHAGLAEATESREGSAQRGRQRMSDDAEETRDARRGRGAKTGRLRRAPRKAPLQSHSTAKRVSGPAPEVLWRLAPFALSRKKPATGVPMAGFLT